jgi:hypothetical protein
MRMKGGILLAVVAEVNRNGVVSRSCAWESSAAAAEVHHSGDFQIRGLGTRETLVDTPQPSLVDCLHDK